MASFDRGTKRQCMHCGMKYYDLNREPVLCPGCGKPYEPPVETVLRKSAGKDIEAASEKDKAQTAKAAPVVAAAAEVKVASFEDGENDTDGDEVEGEDIPDVEGVEDIGGEVDNSFVENDDDDDDLEFKVVTPKSDE